jgi:uncharacterized protein YhfF
VEDNIAMKTEETWNKTLSYWREVNRTAFSEELKSYEKTFDENMMIVCEEFEAVWR